MSLPQQRCVQRARGCVCERERVCACRCQPDFYLPICDAQKRMQKCRFGGGGAGGGEEEMK